MATPAKTKCDVCGGISLNSEMQARQHFTGKSHIKNLRKKGLRVPPEIDFDDDDETESQDSISRDPRIRRRSMGVVDLHDIPLPPPPPAPRPSSTQRLPPAPLPVPPPQQVVMVQAESSPVTPDSADLYSTQIQHQVPEQSFVQLNNSGHSRTSDAAATSLVSSTTPHSELDGGTKSPSPPPPPPPPLPTPGEDEDVPPPPPPPPPKPTQQKKTSTSLYRDSLPPPQPGLQSTLPTSQHTTSGSSKSVPPLPSPKTQVSVVAPHPPLPTSLPSKPRSIMTGVKYKVRTHVVDDEVPPPPPPPPPKILSHRVDDDDVPPPPPPPPPRIDVPPPPPHHIVARFSPTDSDEDDVPPPPPPPPPPASRKSKRASVDDMDDVPPPPPPPKSTKNKHKKKRVRFMMGDGEAEDEDDIPPPPPPPPPPANQIVSSTVPGYLPGMIPTQQQAALGHMMVNQVSENGHLNSLHSPVQLAYAASPHTQTSVPLNLHPNYSLPDMSAATAPKKRPMPSSSTMPTVTPLLPPHIQSEMEKKSRWGPAMDPVAQAVVDNALGKLPKKKKLEIPCAVCELIFNSESQATQHFQGQKHIRRMKTIQDMRKTLQGDESSSNPDTVNRTVRPGGSNFSCHFCNIGFETLQMFEMHRESASHKQAVEAKAASQAKKSEELPGQQTKFYCRVCNVSFRKPGELNQHLSSLTHQDRAAGRVTAKPDDVPPGTTDISLPAYTDTAEPGVPPPPPPPPPPTENSEFTPMWT